MKLYFAPLEGIGKYTYRNAHNELFGGADAYFAPFINPGDREKISRKGMQDILPENNKRTNVRVQVLTANAESFLKFCDKISCLGYDEVNINIGCPASTVVRKGRGSGFLKAPDEMDRFFDGIFTGCEKNNIRVTVKSRTGYASHDELPAIMEVYNRYPISLLIIHPRTREELYGGKPNMDSFRYAYEVSKNKLCYNGDINTLSDFERIKREFPLLDSVMLGRGIIRNPALFREIRGGEPLRVPELISFSERLCEEYRYVLSSDVFTLHKLKEIWIYTMQLFPDNKKTAKALKKARSIEDFLTAIKNL